MPTAIATAVFLGSLGINLHIDQGVSGQSYVAPLKYLGVTAARTGYSHIDQSVLVRQQTGVRFSVFGGCNLAAHLSAARTLAAADGLLALEGPNEVNNFPIQYNGATGGRGGTYQPVAECMRDLSAQVKADAALSRYPVFGAAEASGAETENVGLQFLTIPAGGGTTMPDGTVYADFANAHNYVSSNCGGLVDNQAWQAADPVLRACWDGLAGLYGRTWAKGFAGYTDQQLPSLPRVTTETGWDSVSNVGGEAGQAKRLVNTYLAQFARGWKHTFVYQMKDGEGGTGNQGVYRADGGTKPAAVAIHNLTAALAGGMALATPGSLSYTRSGDTTVHDLLLQKDAITYDLIVWGERASGASAPVTVTFTQQVIPKVYDVLAGTSIVSAPSSSVQLSISDRAMIVEVTTGVAPPPPPPSVTAAGVQAAIDKIEAELAQVRSDVGKLSP